MFRRQGRAAAAFLAAAAVAAASGLPPVRTVGAQESAVASLVTSLSIDPSPRVRAQAALALRPHAAAVSGSLRLALRDGSPVVRAAAARALLDAAPAEAFADLVQAADDDDPLVARTSRQAACRLLGRSSRVQVDVRRMVARVSAPEDWAAKVLHSEVMDVLLRAGNYEVQQSLDFSDEAEPEPDMVITDWHRGPVFAQPAAERAPEPALAVALRGEARVVERSSEGVRVRVALHLSTPAGVVLWSGEATAWGRPGSAAEEDRREGADRGDLAALRTAARMASQSLSRALTGAAGGMREMAGNG